MTLDDVKIMAWNVMALPAPKKNTPDPEAALYKFWVAHKEEVGPRMTGELPLEDGTAAIVTATGKILLWTGGDTVEVL